MSKSYLFFKSFADRIFALFLLFLLSPLYILIIFFLLVTEGTPIFFVQKRPGLLGKPFKLYKFRTMNNKKDIKGNLLPDSMRISKLGNFLRNSSLDELPELINIVKGEMSFIGPRPLLMEYLKLYSDYQFKRHYMKPGITGLAQVNGRNLLAWEKKFHFDIYYIENINFLLDLKIFCKTFWKIYKKEGINSKNNQSVIKFKG